MSNSVVFCTTSLPPRIIISLYFIWPPTLKPLKKSAQKQNFPLRKMGFCCYAGSVTPRVELLSGQLYCERHNCCGSWSFLYSLLLLHCCLLLFQTGPLSLLNMSTTRIRLEDWHFYFLDNVLYLCALKHIICTLRLLCLAKLFI